MKVHCKSCDKTFDTDRFDCDEDLLCPFMQIQIIQEENDQADEEEPPGEANPAPTNKKKSPKRIQQ